MQIACGTDIIEIERIKKSINNIGPKFIDEIYTEKEISYCEDKKKAKYQHYAARFAAKEAVYKALNCFIQDRYSVSWKNIEVVNNENKKPNINLKDVDLGNVNVISMDISLSHCKEYAVANVVILYEVGEKQ